MQRDETPATVQVEVEVAGPVDAEIASAEAWECGALGLVSEEPAGGVIRLIVYLPGERAGALREALLLSVARLSIGPTQSVVEEAWDESWKRHLAPVEVSPRLVVRPSFRSCELAAGQGEVVIDPGQAFGTGAHHSTRLALECLDVSLAERRARSVLDIGTGSGVLALAALRLGAERAVGFDLDPLAEPAAREAARANALDDRFEAVTGGIEDIEPGAFDLVVANLLCSELLPIVRSVVARVASPGALVLAGLLERDVEPVLAALEAAARDAGRPAFVLATRRERSDDDGERWVGLLLTMARAR